MKELKENRCCPFVRYLWNFLGFTVIRPTYSPHRKSYCYIVRVHCTIIQTTLQTFTLHIHTTFRTSYCHITRVIYTVDRLRVGGCDDGVSAQYIWCSSYFAWNSTHADCFLINAQMV